jgi:hypothetical protein
MTLFSLRAVKIGPKIIKVILIVEALQVKLPVISEEELLTQLQLI